jgi:signal transduction histidine kinase
VEILAVYTAPEALETALATGARHLAATLEGFALVYQLGHESREPDGWAGFTCARDAQAASEQLDAFRKQIQHSERPIRGDAPSGPPRIWARAAGGLYGFPLQHAGKTRGVAIVGCPGAWPRIRNAEIESIIRQVALVLDHHAISAEGPGEPQPSDELLRLSEQLLAQDIEQIKREEEQRRIEEFKDDLLERLSCELRTPLNDIIERVISVLADEHENLSETGQQALRKALDEGNYLLRMLQNILDLWRIKRNETRVERQDVNVAEVVEEAIFNVRDKLRPDVIFERRLASPLPKARTDLAKLSQILFHLLDNAAKFTERGYIELELSLADGQLSCSVTDTGIGISARHQPHVFEEFFQVDRSSSRRHRGAGLGLTLTRALIEQLGGSISVSSEVGRGSLFSFTIPVTTL